MQRQPGAPKTVKRRPTNEAPRKRVSWVANTIREFRERSPLDVSAKHQPRIADDERMTGEDTVDEVVTFFVMGDDSPPPSTVLRAAREAVEDDAALEHENQNLPQPQYGYAHTQRAVLA
mmetsp:Transcript_8712/g.22543  ORF Transcript_8712/g.22543 Transcript_8712/m.22543 type:complete len:119 (+) Transcript_8712:760-1116(+)